MASSGMTLEVGTNSFKNGRSGLWANFSVVHKLDFIPRVKI